MSSSVFKILVTGVMTDEGLQHLKSSKVLKVEYSPGIVGHELNQKIKDAQGLIIRTETSITPDLLQSAPELKIICRSGIGVDHIDLGACAKKNIIVMNTPEANRNSVVEMTLGFILSLARKIVASTTTLKNGGWGREEFTGMDIAGKTLGIVGLGNIGQRVAIAAMHLGMKVRALDPYLDPQIAKNLGVNLCTLPELLEQSDFLTLHVPLTKETKGMANLDFFKKMKRQSYFINTSRGAVCIENDLVQALKEKLIIGAALDVFQKEPVEKNNPLLQCEPVILTPHTAGQTVESQRRMSLDAAKQIRNYFENGVVVHAVT